MQLVYTKMLSWQQLLPGFVDMRTKPIVLVVPILGLSTTQNICSYGLGFLVNSIISPMRLEFKYR